MSVSTSVQIDGLEKVFGQLDELPDEVRGEIADAVAEATKLARKVAVKRLTQKQSGNQEGNLRSTIQIRQRPTLKDPVGIVSAGGAETNDGGFDYSLAVEFGTRPHFPPVEAVTGQTESLDIWVRRMNPSPSSEAEQGMSQEELNESVAFQIARRISRVGTKEKPFMRPAYNAGVGKLQKEIRNIDIDL